MSNSWILMYIKTRTVLCYFAVQNITDKLIWWSQLTWDVEIKWNFQSLNILPPWTFICSIGKNAMLVRARLRIPDDVLINTTRTYPSFPEWHSTTPSLHFNSGILSSLMITIAFFWMFSFPSVHEYRCCNPRAYEDDQRS